MTYTVRKMSKQVVGDIVERDMFAVIDHNGKTIATRRSRADAERVAGSLNPPELVMLESEVTP